MRQWIRIKTLNWPALALLAVGIGLGTGCDKKQSRETKPEKVTWPKRPQDGAPAVVQFVKMLEGKRLRGQFRLFNFSGQALRRVDLTLHYQDGGGTELKRFPWTQMGTPLVGAKGYKTFKGGAFIPKGTKTIKVVLERVQYEDGTKWDKNKQADPMAD